MTCLRQVSGLKGVSMEAADGEGAARGWKPMSPLSVPGQKTIQELAQRYGVSTQAVSTLLDALVKGNGTMAQFSHPELGGLGQWSQGGMTMVGDMFNSALRDKVNGLCSDLAEVLRREPSSKGPEASLFVPATSPSSSAWWGVDLGTAAATGSQNEIRYAYFPDARRLAVRIGEQVTIYDTGDHEIGGISQQQSGDSSLTFVSQHGLVRLAELRVVSPAVSTIRTEDTHDNR
jgi:hypothetical protein